MWLNICHRKVKYDRFVAIRCVFQAFKYFQNSFLARGLHHGPCWGTLRRSPEPPVALSYVKWHHGHHLESVMSNRKSTPSVTASLHGNIPDNFIKKWFEMTELYVFFLRGSPQQEHNNINKTSSDMRSVPDVKTTMSVCWPEAVWHICKWQQRSASRSTWRLDSEHSWGLDNPPRQTRDCLQWT